MRGRDGERIVRGEDETAEAPLRRTSFAQPSPGAERGVFVAANNQLFPVPEMQVTELRDGRYPGRVMRALLGIREVCLIVTLALASILMAFVLAGIGTVLNGISQDTDPTPTVTTCVGEVPC